MDMKKNRVQKFAKGGHEKEVVSKNSKKMDMKRNRVQKFEKNGHEKESCPKKQKE